MPSLFDIGLRVAQEVRVVNHFRAAAAAKEDDIEEDNVEHPQRNLDSLLKVHP